MRSVAAVAAAGALTASLAVAASGSSASAATGTRAATVPSPGAVMAAAATVPALSWTACDDGFQCATARAPLDYRRPNGAKISIALVRHLATDPAHRIGSLFVNGGGPSAQLAGFLQAYPFLPAAWRERFDVISFDPRGFGASTAVRCFSSTAAEQQFFSVLPAFPVGARQDAQWERTYARFDALCGERNSKSLLDHVSSADVARDMDLLRQAVGDPVLNYLGISEGTGLGEIYANLFPATVGRIILDTALGPVAWTTADGPLNVDLRWGADEAGAADMAAFLRLCGQAATTACAFSAGTPAATRAKWNTLLQRLRTAPVTAGGQAFSYADVISSASGALQTVGAWQQEAAQLQQVWAASGGSAAPAPASAVEPPVADQPATAAGTPAAPAAAPVYDGLEQGFAQFCTDGPEPHDLAEWATGAKIAAARSGGFGLSQAWLIEGCAQWPGDGAADQYDGPWNRPTANPVLVVANTDDAALPYRNSVAAANDLGNARLLSVRGFGHTVLSNPSACAVNYEDSYLETGALPDAGTICQQDVTPFPAP
jgi:pimeloyl-ACP methyl ester carboxylesterase